VVIGDVRDQLKSKEGAELPIKVAETVALPKRASGPENGPCLEIP
jgi:hypothetical protein